MPLHARSRTFASDWNWLPVRSWGQFLPRLLPSTCAICGSSDDDALCRYCHARYLATVPARCDCCAIPVAPGVKRCGACLQSPPSFDATIVAADYTPPLDQLVLALKFRSRLDLAPLLAALLHDAVRRARSPALPLPDLLAPVPLGERRLAERGFNQALEIARPLAQALGSGLQPRLLARVRETRAQSLLHPEERQANVAAAFSPTPELLGAVAGRHVGIVDDVMTTGETLNAVAATLKRYGASRVTNFVFARTLPK